MGKKMARQMSEAGCFKGCKLYLIINRNDLGGSLHLATNASCKLDSF